MLTDQYGPSYKVRLDIDEELEKVNKWNSDPNHASNQVEKINTVYQGFRLKMGKSFLMGDSSTKINNYFTEPLQGDEKSILDVCLLLRYNCYAKCPSFLKSKTGTNGKPYWYINPNNYTDAVLSKKLPQH